MSRLLTLLGRRGATGNIKSVQLVEITIPTGAASATATVSAVVTAKTAVFWHGQNTTSTGTSADSVFARIELTNATTVTAYRNTSSATDTVTVRATLVEFTSSLVESVQHGTVTFGTTDTSQTAAITSVDTTRSVAFFLGSTTNYTSNFTSTTMNGVQLTDAITVTATRNTAGGATGVAGFCVVQFKASAIASVQQRALTLATTATSGTDTITSVNTANTILIPGGASVGGSSYQNCGYFYTLTNGTTVTMTRAGSSSTTRTLYYTALEFASGVLNSVQRGNTAYTATSSDVTVAAVNTAKALANACGERTTATSYDDILGSVKLLNATTLRAQKNTGTTAVTQGYEVVEFA